MTHSPSPRSLLLHYLDADLAVDLEQGRDLPVAVRADLAAELRHTLAAYAAFIPVRLLRARLADPVPGRVGGAFWQGSLLFADLSGFTALSEQLRVLGKQGAEEVSALINQLFSALVAEVNAYQGTLIKFGGDALTAFFDAESLGEHHAAAAVNAALAMQARMAAFGAVETRAGIFGLALRVGVHSGRVFAAEVGDATHIELVVTGPEVNRVALAQEIAAPGEVVISTQTAELVQAAHLEPRNHGFWRISTLAKPELPAATADPIARNGPDDLATLELLAMQAEALRPYLVRGLPRRFLEPTAADLGEFRPVSVLFVNICDFSALLPSLGDDAATAAAVLNAYFRRAQAVVHRYDGIVNKVDMATHGDKLMALFGAPSAHEDDPLRAVRCALELEQALAAANEEIAALLADRHTPETAFRTLSQRLGINTGTVFAGRVGGAQRYEYTVMGPAVNLAARLMAAAEEGVILLSPSTRAAVARQVAVQEMPPLRLKGLPEPVVPARALHVFEVQRSNEPGPLRVLQRPPLVGRASELERLLAEAQQALRGAGRVLALVGEAGAGKTRLSEELLQRLVLRSTASGANDSVPSFQIYSSDCQSYDQHTPYAIMRAPLRHLLGIEQYHREQQIARPRRGTQPLDSGMLQPALENCVEQLAPELVRFVPLLADVLGLDLQETALTRALTPEQRHARLLDLLVALWHGTATREPLVLALDSIHWADSASLELLERLAQATNTVPLLLLLNYRPEPPIPEAWTTLPTTTRLLLEELPLERSVDLISALLAGPPPQGLLPLLDRTQGNPFFIEELVRALVMNGTLARDGRGSWQFTQPAEQVAVPDSIEGLLLARLDRLDEARHELVQVASVVGRRFQRPVVQGVYSNPATLDEALEQLLSGDIIVAEADDQLLFSEMLAQQLAFLFRHALLRDVAYESILYARRRELHRRVAQRIEELHGKDGRIAEEYLAPLAWHYLRAEAWTPAFRYYVAAGINAQQRYANRDALVLFKTALDIAPYLVTSSDPNELIGLVAGLHERSGDLYTLLGEYDQAEASYQEALALVQATGAEERGSFTHDYQPLIPDIQISIPILRVRLHRLLAAVHERRSSYDTAFAWLERGMALADSVAHAELTRCYLLGAGIYFRQGEYERAMEWSRLALVLAEQINSVVDQAHALSLMGNLWREQGDLGASVQFLEQALTLFQAVNDITRLSDALNNLGQVYLQLGRWPDTIACFEQSLQISQNIGDILATARTSNNLAVVLVGRGELQRAGELYRYSGEQFARIGSIMGAAVTGYNRGEVLLLQGEPQAALALFEESIASFERIRARNFLPEVLRLAAEATLELGDLERARQYLEYSLAVASELGMAVESAVARRVQGQIALQAGDTAAAAELLARSRAELEQLDNRYELGKALCWQARLLQACQQRDAALPLLQQAAAIFRDLDARRDLAVVLALLEE